MCTTNLGINFMQKPFYAYFFIQILDFCIWKVNGVKCLSKVEIVKLEVFAIFRSFLLKAKVIQIISKDFSWTYKNQQFLWPNDYERNYFFITPATGWKRRGKWVTWMESTYCGENSILGLCSNHRSVIITDL